MLNEVFRQNITHDNFTSHQKTGLQDLPSKYIFGKAIAAGQINHYFAPTILG